MSPLWLALVTSALLTFGCDGEEGTTIVVDLRTDFVPGVEFDAVRTRLAAADGSNIPNGGDRDMVVSPGSTYLAGQRVAEYASITDPDVRLTVTLLSDGAEVSSRDVRFAVSELRGVTVVVARSCDGVSCDPSTTCYAGRCVDPGCQESAPDLCGTLECATDGDCVAGPGGCSDGLCVSGACLQEMRSGACSDAEYCDPVLGCVATPGSMDGGSDTSTPDTSTSDSSTSDSSSDSSPPIDAGGDSTVPAPCIDRGDGRVECDCEAAGGAGCDVVCPVLRISRCRMTCGSGQTCRMDCNGLTDCDMDCPVGATCNLVCPGAVMCTEADCAGVSCSLDCDSLPGCV